MRFFERRLNQSLRIVPGTLPARLINVTKRLQAQGRLQEYLFVREQVHFRAYTMWRWSPGLAVKLAAKRGVRIKKGTVKQTWRRLDRVADEIFPPEEPYKRVGNPPGASSLDLSGWFRKLFQEK